MNPPNNGIYIIQGEISLVVTAMRRSSRWNAHAHPDIEGDPLLSSFSQLKDILNNIADLADVEPNAFLSPFLEVIRSEDTTGPITGLALTSVNKFLSYGLVDPRSDLAAPAIENIADAVTHARFVGTDPGSDEVVLMKILYVLRTLLLAPAGVLLTNESVCEIMQSCFRICFEMRLSELLRKSAEHTLMDMVQLLFSRLPQFKEDPKWSANMKKLKMRTGGVDQARMGRRKKSPKPKVKKMKHPASLTTSKNSSPSIPSESSDKTQAVDTDVKVEDVNNVEAKQEISEAVVNEEVTESAENKITEDETKDTLPADIRTTVSAEGVEDPAIDYVNASRESIATTPVDGNTSIIDIANSFQEQYQQETDEAFEAIPASTILMGDDQNEEGELSRSTSNTDLKDHISLAIPIDDTLMRSASEVSLPQSETGDETSLQSLPSATDTQEPVNKDDFINPHGVRFIPHQHLHEGSGPLIPYGLPCVRELFRFLISLTNPLDRHNTDVMIHMGLSLLTVALESGADHIGQFTSLVYLVKDDMCRHLFMLVQSERLSLSAAALRVCFLLFESMRTHLKLQLEMYLTRLSEIITSDHPRITYETRELALESIVQLWRIPGLVTELYLNYDCDLYCSNLFEDLTKLLSKNAFPVAGLFSTHLLSLDALLTVVDSIEQHCHSRTLQATSNLTENLKLGTPEVVSTDSQAVQDNQEEMIGPPTTGYDMAKKLLKGKQAGANDGAKPMKVKEIKKSPFIKPNRMKPCDDIPSAEELMAIKHRKRIYQTGTEYFNNKPSKGITYLQEQGLLSEPLDQGEVINFIKENPKLDKKMLGEFITKRGNAKILEAFVKSFHFEDLRIDEALRQYLEAFRLPGEAPVISAVMEAFSDHWHKSNGEPFANSDAAYCLSYAIIMLNVDQHNHNVKKQNIPMTCEQFKKNLKKTNGDEDFESDMLDEIYNAIKSEEIVMPSEHAGLVKENYLWKVLLKRGNLKDGVFTHAASGMFDHDLFTLIWGPTVAALSFVFDKSADEAIISKAISGFRKCAMISAHYGMSDVFDNLVISLCKFTTLLSSIEAPENIPISFGLNLKAQLAARTVFSLAHRHGDILREGWKNILDCMLQLYRAKLLPKSMIEVEDFVNQSSKICLIKEESQSSQRSESGVISSIYSYFTMSEPSGNKGPTPEEEAATKVATKCIRDCQLEQLIVDSKFLREESLLELIKALIFTSQGPEAHESMGTVYDEDAAVFFFEQFITCILQNRDRVAPIWPSVREHIYSLIVNGTEKTFMVERAVVGLLRIAVRLLRREEMAPQVLSSLQILLMMKPKVIHSISQQISFGLHDLLRTNAANIHSEQDWYTLFVLLEVVGAGANPPPLLQVNSGVDITEGLKDAGAQSDSELPSGNVHYSSSDRGYTSDSELETPGRGQYRSSSADIELKAIPDNGSWMLVNKDDSDKKIALVNPFTIELNENVQLSDCKSLLKSSETLSFLVRDAAHVTPLNFKSCVHAIRAFAEASLNGGHKRISMPPPKHAIKDKKAKHRKSQKAQRMKKSQSTPGQLQASTSSDDEGEGDGMDAELHSLSIQLLDLMHTLHTRANSIYKSWADEKDMDSEAIDSGIESLWVNCWCPLLQGIARLCCDSRRQVRGQALTYLQRALLVHDLQTLSAVEWEACFNKILFPLLTKLLENINTEDPSGMEETRMRASTLLCKVFLQHLSPLLSLSTFTALWLTILDFMDKYMHVDRSDLLTEAIPESLKNMLLVMDTAGIFQTGDGTESQLWKLTWHRIDAFLPHLKEELFKPHEAEPSKLAMDREMESSTPDTGSLPLLQGSNANQPDQDINSVSPDSGNNEPSSNEVATKTGVSPELVQSSENVGLAGSLNTEGELPVVSTYVLHPPLPNLPTSNVLPNTNTNAIVLPNSGNTTGYGLSEEGSVVTTAVPLLLDPELMKDSSEVIRGQPVQHGNPVILSTNTEQMERSDSRSTSPTLSSYPMNRVHTI